MNQLREMNTARVVLADDHAIVRSGIANALRDLPDLEIVGEADTGDTLLAILDKTRPDLLVTDVTMPHFEPIQTTREIRARFPTMKILVVSAYDDDVYVQGLLGVGVDGYHLKDQPLGDLRLAVQRVLAGERWVCSPLVDKLVRTHIAPDPALRLTVRQHDILTCLQEGLDNQAIARRHGLSVKTVENHLTRLYRQLNVQSRLEAVTYLSQHPDAFGAPRPSARNTLYPSGLDVIQSDGPAILIVDDNIRYRTQMRQMVNKSHPQARVYEAETTQHALRQAADIRPRLVFVDVVLGEENGINCARRIKTLAPATQVVLISAYPDREFHRLGLEAGAVAFLDKKDLSAAALHELIADLLN
jgi:DNA-binding NarL/FixJ family response regulator